MKSYFVIISSQLPPDLVTNDQRLAAQELILNFRKTRMPYAVCQYILENSKSDYTLFQAATTIKEAIIRDWSLMNPEAIEGLRSFLLRYITNHITLQMCLKEPSIPHPLSEDRSTKVINAAAGPSDAGHAQSARRSSSPLPQCDESHR
ncbi:exportin-4-like [Elysia marginata]|uniref:Exportin-4 n=1 Tax=Elysia marginata TaxID=1093978 RepID=A0AAV4HNI5_9GAST|nr:exportin-4-like [Elysia marginata]